ncbi:Protein CBG20864 [Caenorhabditis briggsae]|uniref:Protein CBG20864 n=1 Tax=Caenorhabditis briggsae TaxID=6238 RepID=A8XYT7_CAEBR|nr:Protein CBG20864 [Caenorhabditis briggsae]CAP37804.2 Protein CBG20864 [Caenorhabditis briggsae]
MSNNEKYEPNQSKEKEGSRKGVVLKYVFKNMANFEVGDFATTQSEEHFNVNWHMKVKRNESHLEFFIDCQPIALLGDKWSIESKLEFRMMGHDYEKVAKTTKHCFENEETLKYPCLTSIHPKTESLIKMLFDAGEFVKLGLLKEIALVITKKENEEEAIEVHSFKFQCLENGDISTTLNTVAGKSPSQRKHQPVLTPSTSKSREHQIVHLIKSVRNLCASLRPLPKKCAANFRVNYTDLAENNDRIEGFHTTETFYELAKKAVTVEVEKSNQDEQEAVLSCSSVFVKPKFGTSSRFNPSSRESSSASMNSTQKNSSNNKSRNIENETVQLLVEKELLDENNWSYPANLKQSEESL